MTIEINEKIVGIWFVSWENTDWMGAVWRESDGLHGRYRFRYYVDDKALDSQDHKSWYDLKPQPPSGLGIMEKEPQGDLVDAFRELSKKIADIQRGKRWEILRGTCTMEQFFEEFRKLPFAHSGQLTPAEFAKKYPEYLKN